MHGDVIHTALNDDPQNNQFLSPINFVFKLKRAPNLNFFIQRCTFPGIDIPPVWESTPFVDIPFSGEAVKFTPLQIVFRVDENLQNYQEIMRWMLALGEAESIEAYSRLTTNPTISGNNIKSDITVAICDSSRRPNYMWYFHDAFPVNLGPMVFDATPGAITHQVASASFRFTNFDIEKVILSSDGR